MAQKFDAQDIATIDKQISDLINLKNAGIVTDVDVVIHDLMDKKFKIKEKKVKEIHKYAITQTTITKNGKRRNQWQTRCGDSRPRCSSYEALIEKLYTYYFGDEDDFTFKSVFEDALKEKILTERPKEKTVRDYNNSFKALISDELAYRDIRKISQSELQKYILDTVIRLNLTKKRLLKLKGLMNLVFCFAVNPEHKIIDHNPVPQNNAIFMKHCRTTQKNPEEKAFQLDELDSLRDYLWNRVHTYKYDVNGYAILFASWTGMREGELASLKWSDISENFVHIHSQQNDEYRYDEHNNRKKVIYYNPTTKDEKGYSNGGRYFPLFDKVKEILVELKRKQEFLGIKSDWVFARENGSWMTTTAYYEALYRLSAKLHLSLSNNHAFRMALNSYIFIPMGLPVTDGAKMLGHSIETNQKYYSYARSKDHLAEISQQINNYIASIEKSGTDNGGTLGYLKILDFEALKKSQKTANLKALF